MMAKEEFARELAEIRRAKKNHSQRVENTPRLFLGVSSFVIQTVMSILSLSNMSFDMAVDWLMDTKRKGMKVPEEITRATATTALEEMVLAADAAEIVSWGDRDRCLNQTSLRIATD